MYRNFLLFAVIVLFNSFIGVYTENANYIIAILRKESDKNYDDESIEIQNKIDELLNDRMNDIYDVIDENKDTYILSNGKQDDKLKELNTLPFEKRSEGNKKLYFINNRKRKNKKASMILTSSKLSSSSSLKSSTSKLNSTSELLSASTQLLATSSASNNSTIEYIPFESNLVTHICPASNYYVINAYLSEDIKDIVCKMKNVLYCQKSRKLNLLKIEKPEQEKNNDKIKGDDKIKNEDEMKNDDDNEIKFESNKNKNNDKAKVNVVPKKHYYDINAIKKETKWSDVSVQQISYNPNHLALISQGVFVGNNKTVDSNFYYPSSAGKGIDIYIVDEGLIVDHEDFNKYEGTSNERTITCDVIIKDHDIHYSTDEEKSNCSGTGGYPEHGIMVSSSAGGTLYGVAKNANIHMVANDFNDINALRSYDYIIQNAKPHKTVINLSFGNNYYNKIIEDKLVDLINKGFIIVVAAGNDFSNCCGDKDSDEFFAYAGYRKAITVGATVTELSGNGLEKSQYSNYGDCVDIFAPGRVTYPKIEDGNRTLTTSAFGTSCSAPLVAGVIASIMSEHPDIEYDNESMRKTLKDMAIKDAIRGLMDNTPNRFINNGKRSNYYPNITYQQCGASSDKKAACIDGCCTKDGECIALENNPGDKCFIENGCQSEFGYCTTKEKSIKECKQELNEHKECLIEISLDDEQDDTINQCKIFKSEKCQNFYNSLYSNQSICSIAKNFEKIEYIDKFDINMINVYSDNCSSAIRNDYDECIEAIHSYELCLIEDSYDDDDVTNLKGYARYSSINNCNKIRSKKCKKLYEDPKKALLSNPSCAFVNEVNPIDINETFGEKTLKKALNNVKILDKQCDIILKDPVQKCNEELENYKECFTSLPEDISEDELLKKCRIFKSEKCVSLYEKRDSVIPSCEYAKSLETIELFDQMKKAKSIYDDACVYEISDDLKEKYIAECEEEMKESKCVFTYQPEMSEDELIKKCESFLSANCTDIRASDFTSCDIASYHSEDIENAMSDFDSNRFDIEEICELVRTKENTIEECKFEIMNKEICLLKGEPKDENDLKYRCWTFLSDECQTYYNDDSLSNVCQIAQRYMEIPKFDTSSEKYKYYEKTCKDMDLHTNVDKSENPIKTEKTSTSALTSTSIKTSTSTPIEKTTSIIDTTTSSSTEIPTEIPTNTTTSSSTEIPTEIPTNTTTSSSTEIPTEIPTNTTTSSSTEIPTEIPTNTTTSSSTEITTKHKTTTKSTKNKNTKTTKPVKTIVTKVIKTTKKSTTNTKSTKKSSKTKTVMTKVITKKNTTKKSTTKTNKVITTSTIKSKANKTTTKTLTNNKPKTSKTTTKTLTNNKPKTSKTTTKTLINNKSKTNKTKTTTKATITKKSKTSKKN